MTAARSSRPHKGIRFLHRRFKVCHRRSNSSARRLWSRAFCFFLSKKLSSAQQNYSTYERESLAVLCAVEHFRVYLLGRPFRLRTNHCDLQWLLSKEPKASARVSGYIASLMEYPIAVEYIKGTENTIADILSRLSGHAVNQVPPAELAKGVSTNVFPVSDADRLEVSTHWLREQRNNLSCRPRH